MFQLKENSKYSIRNIASFLKNLTNKTIMAIARIFIAPISARHFLTPFKNSNQFLIPKPDKVHSDPKTIDR